MPSGEETARALARYGNEVVLTGSSYALQPRFLAWGGAATVARHAEERSRVWPVAVHQSAPIFGVVDDGAAR